MHNSHSPTCLIKVAVRSFVLGAVVGIVAYVLITDKKAQEKTFGAVKDYSEKSQELYGKTKKKLGK